MPVIKDVDVWVEVEGARANEYQTDVKGDHGTAYIVSEQGKTFEIVVRNAPQMQHALQMWAFVDGVDLGATVCDPRGAEGVHDGAIDERGRPVRCRFDPIRLTDDDEQVTATEATIKGAGSIRIELRRIDSYHITDKIAPASSVISSGPVVLHEQSKKAQLKHTIGYASEDAEAAKCEVFDASLVDPADGPAWGTITFLYRSRDWLEAQGIIKAPGPTREIRKDSKPLKSKKEAATSTKRKSTAQSSAEDVKRVKPDPDLPAKPPRKGEVIDLTSD